MQNADQQQPLDGVHAGAAGGAQRERLQRDAGDAEPARHARRDHHAERARQGLRDLVRLDLARSRSGLVDGRQRRDRGDHDRHDDPFAVEPIQVQFTRQLLQPARLPPAAAQSRPRARTATSITAGRLFDVSGVTSPRAGRVRLRSRRRSSSTSSCRRPARAVTPARAPPTPRRRPPRPTTTTTTTPRAPPPPRARAEAPHEQAAQQNAQTSGSAKDARMKKVAIGGAVLVVVLRVRGALDAQGTGGASSSTPPARDDDLDHHTGTRRRSAQPPPERRRRARELPNSDVAPRRSKSQLYSFSRFAGKDPFVQQVADVTLGSPTSPAWTQRLPDHAGPTAPVGTTAAVQTPQVTRYRTLATDWLGEDLDQRQASRPCGSAGASRARTRSSGSSRLAAAWRGSASRTARTRAAHRPSSLVPGRSLTLVDTADGIRYTLRLLTSS